MVRFRDAWVALFANEKYSQSEKQKLTKLCDLAKFPDDYHIDIFKQFELEKPIKDVALSKDKFDLPTFVQNGSHIFNAEAKQIVEELEKYVFDPSKNKYRINKIIAAVLYSLITKKLFLARHDSVPEVKKRIAEVQSIQDWICEIHNFQNPKIIEDDVFIEALDSVNGSLDKIDELLEAKIKELERQDILNGFDGVTQLKAVIDNVVEYLSSLSNDKKGFSVSKLLHDAARKDSDAQMFLTRTNIGMEILTHLLSLENVQKLFSVDTEIKSLHSFTGNVDSRLEVYVDIWEDKDKKKLIIELLLLLDGLASSACTSDLIKKAFSGVVGNAGLLGPNKESILRFFGMSSDGLEKLKASLKSLHDSLLRLGQEYSTKRTQLRRLYKTCNTIIAEAKNNFDKVVSGIHDAPPMHEVLEQFKERMQSIEVGIKSFTTDMLPLLPDDARARYALMQDSSGLSVECSSNTIGLQTVGMHQVPRVNPTASSPTLANYMQGYTIAMSRYYINSMANRDPIALASIGRFIEKSTRDAIAKIERTKEEFIASTKEENAQRLTTYIDKKNKRRNLKVVGATAGFAGAPVVSAIVTGTAIHLAPTVSLVGFTAVMPWGTVGGVGAALLASAIVAGVAAKRVREIPEEELKGRTLFTLWLDEVQKCFTFSDEHMRNQNLYHRLCAWTDTLSKCSEEIIDKVVEKNACLEFSIKALEAVISYSTSHEKNLLNNLQINEEEDVVDTDSRSILNHAIKLRCAFLKLIYENELYFIEEVKVKNDRIQGVEDTFRKCKINSNEKEAIEAAKWLICGLLCATLEFLKEMQREVSMPSMSLDHSYTESINSINLS